MELQNVDLKNNTIVTLLLRKCCRFKTVFCKDKFSFNSINEFVVKGLLAKWHKCAAINSIVYFLEKIIHFGEILAEITTGPKQI